MSESHWTLAIEPLLEALRPRRVGATRLDPNLFTQLARLAGELHFQVVDAAEERLDAIVAGPGAKLDFGVPRSLTVIVGDDERRAFPGPDSDCHFVGGFGGLTAIADRAALKTSPDFARAWAEVGSACHLEAVCAQLERERVRLDRAAAEDHARRANLIAELESVVAELEAREAGLEPLLEALEDATAQVRALLRRKRLLERRAARAEAAAAAAREQLLADRVWVAKHARAVADSQAWRWGHGITTSLRTLTFRRSRGTNGLTAILKRVDDEIQNQSAG